jgi:WD40 repeat protein
MLSMTAPPPQIEPPPRRSYLLLILAAALFALCVLLAGGIFITLRTRPATGQPLHERALSNLVVVPQRNLLFGLQGSENEPSLVDVVAIDLSSKVEMARWKLSGDRPHYAVSPDGKLLVEGSWPLGNLAFWDVGTKKQLKRLETQCTALAFSPDGKTLAVCEGNALALWNPVTRTRGKELEARPDLLLQYLIFHDGGKRLLAANYDGRTTDWNVETGKAERKFSLHDPELGGTFYGFILSPDERYLATMELLSDYKRSNRVKLWDLTGDGKPKSLWQKPGTSALAFSPDSQLLAMGLAKEYAVRYAQKADGETMQVLRVPSGEVASSFPAGKRHAPAFAAAFTPDGRRVIESSGTGVQTWSVP